MGSAGRRPSASCADGRTPWLLSPTRSSSTFMTTLVNPCNSTVENTQNLLSGLCVELRPMMCEARSFARDWQIVPVVAKQRARHARLTCRAQCWRHFHRPRMTRVPTMWQFCSRQLRTSILRGRSSGRFGIRTVKMPSLRSASMLPVSSSLPRTKLRRYTVERISA